MRCASRCCRPPLAGVHAPCACQRQVSCSSSCSSSTRMNANTAAPISHVTDNAKSCAKAAATQEIIIKAVISAFIFFSFLFVVFKLVAQWELNPRCLRTWRINAQKLNPVPRLVRPHARRAPCKKSTPMLTHKNAILKLLFSSGTLFTKPRRPITIN